MAEPLAGYPGAGARGWARVWALARRKPLGAVSAGILCVLLAVALLAPLIAPYDPYKLNLNDRGLPIRMQSPNWTFPSGRTRWAGTC